MRLIRPRFRTFGAVLLVAAVSVGIVAITTAGPSAKSARAQTVTCAPGTTVHTTYGQVCGITSRTVRGVDEWLGIPYAAPPLGKLRWKPPQAPARWTDTLRATAFGSECTQTSGAGSEDCLFVNVWAPATATPTSNLPVLVHIHGGGFTSGDGDADNSLLASIGNEVIVSMNYRLNIFGFLVDDKALGTNSGDYGLQDQQAALRWVKSNIAAFGGDPRKVTTFGESAGGSSQCDLIASPTAAGLFDQAISVSGEYNTLLGYPTSLEPQDCKSFPPTKREANAAGEHFAAAAGCGAGSATAVAACLRALPASTVESLAGGTAHPGGYQNGGRGTVGPTINGTTLTMSLRQALATGHVNRVRVIAGTDRDEDLVAYANRARFPVTTAAAYTRLVDTQYGSFAPKVLSEYPVTNFASPGLAWRTVAADSDTICPSLVTDQDLARRIPVYAYEIDDDDIPPYARARPGIVAAGASHVGGWFLNPVTPALDADQQMLQKQEIEYVTTFARTGVPAPTGALAWPRFNSSNPEELSLQPAGDTEVVSVAEVSAQHNCGFWDRIAPRP
ncbi:MAG TPA: carboxylesterase family protein [Solirubrobacteraceae bacterium]|nr:carboxylesterase family protein [Solirubrobacteraceae bacterium]